MAKRKKADTSSDAPAQTIEGLNDEQTQALTFQHKGMWAQRLAAKKKADAELKNAAKLIKSELGAGGLKDIKDMIALESEEGEAAHRAEIERQMRVARWMGMAVGHEADLFDSVDRTPAGDKAEAEGKRAGMQGQPRKPTHDPSTEQYRRWMAGYDQGQTILAQGFKKPVHGGEAAAAAAKAGDAHIASQIGGTKPTHTVRQ